MYQAFKDQLTKKYPFLSGFLSEPKLVGAVWPTGPVMARIMASIVRIDASLPVLELGPGTGVITKAILAKGLPDTQLHAVEYSPQFARQLSENYPNIHVHEGDAFNLSALFGAANDAQFDCAVSALPLLNFPSELRVGFIIDVLARLPHGRPLIQFSYGPKAPVPALAGQFTVEIYDFVLRNIPPARIWIYKKVL